MDIAIDRGV